MDEVKLSRRKFLLLAGSLAGAGALACSSLARIASPAADINFPESFCGDPVMQTKKILVTYASRSGATAGVAQAIADTLSENGFCVDLYPVEKAADLSAYRAVIAGSAIQGQKWLPEAMDFVRSHRESLKRMPFAAFLVCMTLSMNNAGQYREGVSSWLQPVRSLAKPFSEGLFAGTLEFDKMPITLNTLAMRAPVLLGMWQKGDHRDWGAIRSWAKSLAGRLV